VQNRNLLFEGAENSSCNEALVCKEIMSNDVCKVMNGYVSKTIWDVAALSKGPYIIETPHIICWQHRGKYQLRETSGIETSDITEVLRHCIDMHKRGDSRSPVLEVTGSLGNCLSQWCQNHTSCIMIENKTVVRHLVVLARSSFIYSRRY